MSEDKSYKFKYENGEGIKLEENKITTSSFGRHVLIGIEKFNNEFTFVVKSLSAEIFTVGLYFDSHGKSFFYHSNGNFYEGFECKGKLKELKIDDEIEFKGNVNPFEFTIKVNGSEVHIHKKLELGDIKLFPYIYLLGKSKTVKIECLK